MSDARVPSPDARVAAAIHHWAPRFVANGVPLTDFQEVTAGIARWEDWCGAWSARAAVHEVLGDEAHAQGFNLSAGEHWNRAAVCYHFAKFVFVEDVAQMKAAHLKAVACRARAPTWSGSTATASGIHGRSCCRTGLRRPSPDR